MGLRPKRFDIAGAHPDEVYGAVADLVRAVDQVGDQWAHVEGFPRDLRSEAAQWRQTRPMRFAADNLDADVQQFMAQGVRILDRAKKELPVGLSGSHEQVRDRCHKLAESMEKVLQKRQQGEPPLKAWNYVKVNATPATVKQPGQTALSVEKTVQAVKDIARGHFEGSAWKAGVAQRSYWDWAKKAEVESEKTGVYPPMPDGARSWHAFMGRVDNERMRSALKGEHWAHVDVNEGINFSQVMNFAATYRQRPQQRQRM
jgi:hypothetical protein